MGKKPKLSKKELRKIEKKAIAKAEKKAAAKAEKKRDEHAKGMKKAKTKGADRPTESAASATGAVDESAERHPHLQHLDRVAELQLLLDPDQPAKVRKAAQKELDQLRAEGEAINAKKAGKTKPEAEKTLEEQDAEMKARIAERRAGRGPDTPGSPERLRAMQAEVAARQGIPGPDDSAAERAARASKITLGDVTPAAVDAYMATGAPERYADAEAAHEADEAAEQEREKTLAIASEAGLEPVSTGGDNPVENFTFAKPSEAPLVDFEVNGNGQYKVKRLSDGKIVGFTRTTTYIDNLEDKSALTKWKMRMLLEGVAAAEEPGEREGVTAQIRELAHRRDVAIAKARKKDRKGDLQVGQLGALVDGAWGAFKKAMDALADEVFELGGGREAATKGTDIHALTELYDSEGIDAVQELLEEGEITPADFADVEAYAYACQTLGLKVVAIEQVIVNDDLQVAGRLDRIYLAKLPEIRDPKTGEVLRVADARAKRYVGDVKTGRVDYGQGKMAQQLRMYADSKAYDLNTHERSSHGANRSLGLIIHLPAGSGKAEVLPVFLDIGARGNKLSGEVRSFRNEGKKAIVPVDLAEVAQKAATEAAAEREESEQDPGAEGAED
jgi:hypothetical protein